MNNKNWHRRDNGILRAIYFLSTPTRNEIARHAGISPVSVTEALNRLLAEGRVERAGKKQSGSGRPSATYRLTSRAGLSIGISLDESTFRIVAVDSSHDLVRELVGRLALSSDPASHAEEILTQLTAELRRLLSDLETDDRKLRAVGITPPGMVDPEKGSWVHCLQVSGIEHMDLAAAIGQWVKVPVVVEDSARCLAYLEALRRYGRGVRDLVYLYLGPGVGAGLIINDEPYHGSHGMAGEVGHLVVEAEGARCSCGSIGCLETVISTTSILQRFKTRLAEGVISGLQLHREGDGLTLDAIAEAAATGDRLATSTLFELGTLLGDAVSKIIKLYNPRTLVVGGPAAVLGGHLREAMWLSVRQKVLPEMLVDLAIEITPSGPRDEALGAAYLAERHSWRAPEPARKE